MNPAKKSTDRFPSRRRLPRVWRYALFGTAILLVGLGENYVARAQDTGIASTAASPSAPETDKAAIRGILVKYAKSVDAADTNLASQIWSQSADVTFVWPLGRERGFDQIKRNVYESAMAGTFSERQLNIRNISIHVYGGIAWAEFDWDFAAKLNAAP